MSHKVTFKDASKDLNHQFNDFFKKPSRKPTKGQVNMAGAFKSANQIFDNFFD